MRTDEQRMEEAKSPNTFSSLHKIITYYKNVSHLVKYSINVSRLIG